MYREMVNFSYLEDVFKLLCFVPSDEIEFEFFASFFEISFFFALNFKNKMQKHT